MSLDTNIQFYKNRQLSMQSGDATWMTHLEILKLSQKHTNHYMIFFENENSTFPFTSHGRNYNKQPQIYHKTTEEEQLSDDESNNDTDTEVEEKVVEEKQKKTYKKKEKEPESHTKEETIVVF